MKEYDAINLPLTELSCASSSRVRSEDISISFLCKLEFSSALKLMQQRIGDEQAAEVAS